MNSARHLSRGGGLTILLIDPSPDTAALARSALGEDATLHCFDSPEALSGDAAAASLAHDLVVLSMSSTPAWARAIKQLQANADAPIIVLAENTAPSVHIAALRAGADDFLVKPIDPAVLRAHARRLLAQPAPNRDLALAPAPGNLRRRILLIDDDPIAITLFGAMLFSSGLDVVFSTEVEGAIALSKEARFDLIILDAIFPNATGFEVCRRLREGVAPGERRVIFLTAHLDESLKQQAYDAGAQDVLSKSMPPRLLKARILHHLGS